MALHHKRGLRAVLATSTIPVVLRPKKAERKPSRRVADIEARIESAWSVVAKDEWRGVELERCGPVLVGLWAKLHLEIYGVDVASSLAVGNEWVKAVVAAKRVALRIGDVGDAIDFVTWAWKAEERQERRRKTGEIDNQWRLSWQNLFLRPGTVLDFQANRKRS